MAEFDSIAADACAIRQRAIDIRKELTDGQPSQDVLGQHPHNPIDSDHKRRLVHAFKLRGISGVIDVVQDLAASELQAMRADKTKSKAGEKSYLSLVGESDSDREQIAAVRLFFSVRDHVV